MGKSKKIGPFTFYKNDSTLFDGLRIITYTFVCGSLSIVWTRHILPEF